MLGFWGCEITLNRIMLVYNVGAVCSWTWAFILESVEMPYFITLGCWSFRRFGVDSSDSTWLVSSFSIQSNVLIFGVLRTGGYFSLWHYSRGTLSLKSQLTLSHLAVVLSSPISQKFHMTYFGFFVLQTNIALYNWFYNLLHLSHLISPLALLKPPMMLTMWKI